MITVAFSFPSFVPHVLLVLPLSTGSLYYWGGALKLCSREESCSWKWTTKPFFLENQAGLLKQNQLIQQSFCHNSLARPCLQSWEKSGTGQSKGHQGKMFLKWDLFVFTVLSCVFSLRDRKIFLWIIASSFAALTHNVWVSSPEFPWRAVSATDALHMREKHVLGMEHLSFQKLYCFPLSVQLMNLLFLIWQRGYKTWKKMSFQNQ